MSNFSYDDFAVLVRSFDLGSLDLGSLCIVPLSEAPSMAEAIKGDVLTVGDGKAYLPLGNDDKKVSSNVTVQHKSDGYCRLVGHLVPEVGEDGTALPATVRAFVLYHSPLEGDISNDKVLAVASLKEGFEIGDGCYPSFTITTVNNYQSVAFNPNAFATVEDLKNINGLDGLHIAFDQATGDIKLLDKDGNVIDQANLPIKADVIIADGEEGYKYVKTDIRQDIHATKAWMPVGENGELYTAWDSKPAVEYKMKYAALVVKTTEAEGTRYFVTDAEYPITDGGLTENGYIEVDGKTYYIGLDRDPSGRYSAMTGDGNHELFGEIVETEVGRAFRVPVKYEIKSYPDGDKISIGDQSYSIVRDADDTIWEARLPGNDSGSPDMIGTIEETAGGSSTSDVVGITVGGEMMYAIDEETTVSSVSGEKVPWLAQRPRPETGYSLRYGLEAFVWTVKDPDTVTQGSFFAELNDSLLSLGFHEGDDIALGTNLSALANIMDGRGDEALDPEEYMHGEDMAVRAAEVAEQRNLAKEELGEWNAQYPALTHNAKAGTRISSDGVDIRDGKLSIGDGVGLEPADGVKRYELSTNFSEWDDSKDTGLALSVVDASGGEARNVLTISDSSYISGAPICMAMLEIYDDDEGLKGDPKRRTACFDCAMSEDVDMGTVNITITDNRLNSKGFSGDCIVEISPVYRPGVPTPSSDETSSEMLPALNTVNTVATVSVSEDNKSQLKCTCPQIIDWANSVNLNEGGARLFAIVKVY